MGHERTRSEVASSECRAGQNVNGQVAFEVAKCAVRIHGALHMCTCSPLQCGYQYKYGESESVCLSAGRWAAVITREICRQHNREEEEEKRAVQKRSRSSGSLVPSRVGDYLIQ